MEHERPSTLASTAHQLDECVAIVARAESVDDRICKGVTVAEPEENVEERTRRAVSAKCTDEIDGEEWSPTEDEAADYDSDGLGGFLFTIQTAHRQVQY